MRSPATAARTAQRRHPVVLAACALVVLVPALALDGPAASAAPAASRLVIFKHPLHGGSWSSFALRGVTAVGDGTPVVAATSSRSLVIAQRSPSGNLVVSAGAPTAPLTTVDLGASIGAPLAAGRPALSVTGSGEISLWYRTATGALEVLTSPGSGQPFGAVDVSAATGGAVLGGDPCVVTARDGSVAAYAVTQGGTLLRFNAPTSTSPWSASDPTQGLSLPMLKGGVFAAPSPSAPAATVVVVTGLGGNLLELSNQVAAPYAAVGPWHVADLSALGASRVGAGLSGAQGSYTFVTYLTPQGRLAVVTLDSGLLGGASSLDLSRLIGAQPDAGVVPTAVGGPFGAAVAYRSTAGSLELASLGTMSVSNLSFQRSTAEYTTSDAGSTALGGDVVLVARDGGPIAPSPLRRRILLLASSFDQQHARLQTTPPSSDCNPFTAAWGRGSTWGCKPGTAAEAWCSDFAQWVWQTAGVPTAGISGWSASFATWGAAHRRITWGTKFTPIPGDAIVWGTRAPLYGTHVGLIVAVHGKYIDVENGNSGGDLPGFEEGVWRSGLMVGATSTVSGYRVLAVVRP